MVYDYSHFHRREPEMTLADTMKTLLPWTAYVASKEVIVIDGKVVFTLVAREARLIMWTF
jgi:hypothetical protein